MKKRNIPLKAFVKPSPTKTTGKDVAKFGVKVAKPLLAGLGKRVAGLAGLFLGSVKTASADQPGTGKHGGSAVSNMQDNINMVNRLRSGGSGPGGGSKILFPDNSPRIKK